ncbi:hypothetical protein AX15_004107 [Amanita polypyramis BW_CC]|nr:hypothetical protein AX15_004107 [Amanita polypyramis BW_CC]
MNRFAQLGYVVRNQSDGASSGAGSGAAGVGGWGGDGRSGEWGRWEGRTEGEGGLSGKGASSLDDTIQHMPRRVLDALRKEVVVGIAASKMASACWTAGGDLFTWGTNSGQLGYERSSQPQVLPRKVTKIAHKVIDAALSDTAVACLLHTRDVICVWNDKEIKINFPVQSLPPKIQPYRPPPRKRDAGIAKLTTCDDVFAALSLYGEVFVFTPPDTSSGGDVTGGGKTALIKPQRAWVLKKKYRAVKDVALGASGDIIVCTESGHVFVRTRSPTKVSASASQTSDKSGSIISGSLTTSNLAGPSTASATTQSSKIGSNFKFVYVPHLQRITKVCANNTGAFGALKVDYRHAPIEIVGNGVAEDLKEVMPFVVMYGNEEWERTKKGGRYGLGLKRSEGQEQNAAPRVMPQSMDPDDADMEDVKEDIFQLRCLCELIEQEKKGRKEYPKDRRLPFDADIVVLSQSEAVFPAHRVILAARSPVLCSVLAGGKAVKDEKAIVSVRFVTNKGKQVSTSTRPFPSLSTCGKLMISGCRTLTILIFLTYLYSDELLAIWDPRVKTELQKECAQLKTRPDQIKAELQALAKLLDLPLMSEALNPWVKRVPAPSVAKDLSKLWLDAQGGENHAGDNVSARKSGPHNPLAPDVLLQLADRDVWCHSVLLRTRSDLFASLFGEEEWTVNRWSNEGMLTLNMRHLKWHVMHYVLRFVFCEEEKELFERLDFADSLDDVLEFMFSVMGVATELLLDRLVLVCSAVILEHVNIQNACYVLNDATHYNAKQLIERLQMYMTANLEPLLEQRMLDDFPHRLVKQLGAFARRKQAEKSPISRTTILVDTAIERHAGWLALQDIPERIVRLTQPQGRGVNIASKRSGLSLASATAAPTESSMEVASAPPSQRTIRRPPSGEEIFIMDPEGSSPTDVSIQSAPAGKARVWKAHSVPRVDMKSLMAEEAANVSPSPPASAGVIRKSMQIRQTASKEGISTMPSPVSSLQRTSSTSWRTPANSHVLVAPKMATPPGTPPTSGLSQAVSAPRKRENVPGTPPGELGIASVKPQPVPTPATPTRSSQRPQTAPDGRSNLGPVITPTRQLTKTKADTPSIRRVSGKVWVLPPVEPVIATSPTPPQIATSMSFTAIQQLQLEQATVPAKDRQTLRDIQAEEEARQQEEIFLRWWASEEERVRLESEEISRALNKESQAGPQGSKSKRKGKGGGAGGGGGKGSGLGHPSHNQSEQSRGGAGSSGEQQRGMTERKRKQPRKPTTRSKKPAEDANVL